MDGLFSSMGGGQVILIPHLIMFIVALRRWLRREIVWRFGAIIFDLLGFVATLVVVPMFFVLLFDSANAPVMSVGAAYLIYAFATLGLFVVLTLTICYWSGRFVGRMMQLWRIRKLGKNLGRPA